jgi:hypothetical protein
MPQKVKLNRDDRRPMFLSDKVKAYLPDVDTPNGCVYPEGQEGDQGPMFFQQGTGGQQTLGANVRYGMGTVEPRKTYGGNRSGE